MTTPIDVAAETDRELVLARLVAAPRQAVWRCWTEPDLLRRWFAPRPWTTPEAALDLRPGGESRVVMRSPEGQDFPSVGVYLEVVERRRLVFTDAYSGGWAPSEKPFMTAVLDFADADGGTRYVARARHWTDADREAHVKMGFHEGWGQCADQLEAVAQSL